MPDLPPISRRDLVISAAVGALAGTAWGMSFVNASDFTDQPEITVLRTPSLAILLIEIDKARILVVDGQLDQQGEMLVERATGFLRRRLDVLIAGNSALANLTSDFIDHWHISTVFCLPGDNPGFAEPISDHMVEIGDLKLTATPVMFGEWNRPQLPTSRSWYLEVEWHDVRCIYLSSQAVINRIRSRIRGNSTLFISNDPDPEIWRFQQGNLLALPADAIDRSTESDTSPQIVRLFRDVPQVFRLEDGAITVRKSSGLG